MTQAPVEYLRQPQWSDTDAAHIVFTGRIADYVIEAIDHFMREVVGIAWFEMNMDHNMGTPFVSVSYDIYKPITPRGPLRCPILVEKLGTSSVIFHVEIFLEDGTKAVDGRTVNVFVDKNMKKIDIPTDIRERIQNYMDAGGSKHG
ncbi:acyl-CoA thioesterase [Marinobacterium mangrovicola]|uniref:Acyl-CoA thioesterase FadM n=1 Tax=Marinobacterium mangrovicola TaxID=1476959 RepID=A0A4R1GJC2_9GAMM|nr:acyl-CoA thioesterase [Marinobacterium mangrovicola]TCK06975.1 acyl-CoA thioesterase FadM [Marinobacterium mangrovicola]